MSDGLRRPKVSVCVTAFNHEKYISECLESILNQSTSFDFEIIVGDDCSADRTRDVIKEFIARHPSRVRAVFHSANVDGGAFNYRAVHRLAHGEYIAHIDGDDIMEPLKLQRQSDFLDANPACSMVVHPAYVLDLGGAKRLKESRRGPPFGTLLDLLRRQCYFVHSSKMYRAVLNETSSIMRAEGFFIDFESHLECAAVGPIGYVDEPLVTYRVHVGSMTNSGHARGFELFLFTLRGYERAKGFGVSVELVERYKSIYVYKSAVYFARRGSIEFAERCFAEYDRIPRASRSRIFGYLLFGNSPAVRTLLCRLIAGMRTRVG
jgi:glycosyltransferase involved in cell wall biosynthesis